MIAGYTHFVLLFLFSFSFFFFFFSFLAQEMDDALVMLKMEEAGFSTAVVFPSQP